MKRTGRTHEATSGAGASRQWKWKVAQNGRDTAAGTEPPTKRRRVVGRELERLRARNLARKSTALDSGGVTVLNSIALAHPALSLDRVGRPFLDKHRAQPPSGRAAGRAAALSKKYGTEQDGPPRGNNLPVRRRPAAPPPACLLLPAPEPLAARTLLVAPAPRCRLRPRSDRTALPFFALPLPLSHLGGVFGGGGCAGYGTRYAPGPTGYGRAQHCRVLCSGELGRPFRRRTPLPAVLQAQHRPSLCSKVANVDYPYPMFTWP